MPAESWVRAADMDREEIIEILQRAYVEGRLDQVQLEARTDEVFFAQTIGELRALIADVPPRGAAAILPSDQPSQAADLYPRLGLATRRRVSLLVVIAALACLVIGAATRDTTVIALAVCAGVVLAVLRRWYWRS
ncbi:MAG TPA: DUF1707 domain-containing protein [Trebonia sp.]